MKKMRLQLVLVAGLNCFFLNDVSDLMQVVDALVPLAEMFQYVSTLRGMTKGRASYIMQLAKFDVVPQHIQNQLTAKGLEVAA